MEGMKKLTVIILAVVLWLCECMFMGIFAVDAGASERSVKSGLEASNIVTELTESTLKANTVNMGGAYGDKMTAVMGSDAMTDFFTAYISSGIKSIVYGNDQPEIANDELLQAFSEGIDQVNVSGNYSISSDEQALFEQYISNATPDLTASLSDTMSKYELVTTDATNSNMKQSAGSMSFTTMMKPMVRIVLGLIILAAIFIIATLSKGTARFGVRSVMPTLLATGIYGYLGYKGTSSLNAADAFMSQLVKCGATTVAIGGALACVILTIISIAIKRKSTVNALG